MNYTTAYLTKALVNVDIPLQTELVKHNIKPNQPQITHNINQLTLCIFSERAPFSKQKDRPTSQKTSSSAQRNTTLVNSNLELLDL